VDSGAEVAMGGSWEVVVDDEVAVVDFDPADGEGDDFALVGDVEEVEFFTGE